jgi:hypothetical protein
LFHKAGTAPPISGGSAKHLVGASPVNTTVTCCRVASDTRKVGTAEASAKGSTKPEEDAVQHVGGATEVDGNLVVLGAEMARHLRRCRALFVIIPAPFESRR